MAGLESIRLVNAPISRSVETLSIFAEAVITHGQPWLLDPTSVPLPWQKVTLPTKLSIGVFRHDGVITSHPPVVRAIDTVVQALKKAGHEVIEFEPYNHTKGVDFMSVSDARPFGRCYWLPGKTCLTHKRDPFHNAEILRRRRWYIDAEAY